MTVVGRVAVAAYGHCVWHRAQQNVAVIISKLLNWKNEQQVDDADGDDDNDDSLDLTMR